MESEKLQYSLSDRLSQDVAQTHCEILLPVQTLESASNHPLFYRHSKSVKLNSINCSLKFEKTNRKLKNGWLRLFWGRLNGRDLFRIQYNFVFAFQRCNCFLIESVAPFLHTALDKYDPSLCKGNQSFWNSVFQPENMISFPAFDNSG